MTAENHRGSLRGRHLGIGPHGSLQTKVEG